MASSKTATMVKVIQTTEEWTATLAAAKADNKVCIVDFSAEWCGPCQMITPLFEKLEAKPENANLIFLNVDVDKLEDVAASCKITAMPTFQVWKDEAKEDEVVGANPEKLELLIAKYGAAA